MAGGRVATGLALAAAAGALVYLAPAVRRTLALGDRARGAPVAPLPGRGATRVLHATAQLEGRDVELLWGLYPNGPAVHGVMAAAETPAFARLRGELEGILASVRALDPPEPR